MSASDRMMPSMTAPKRCFLFLQGPHGSFFPRLGAALLASGHRVRRINFNGGDRATWPGGDAFRGFERAWPTYVTRYMARHAVTDLIVFGDCRPVHAAAIAAATTSGVRVHVFEEGYIRPDWITLERDGVNGNSRLPRDPDWYLREARALPPVPDHPPVPSFATGRGWAAFFYYAEVVLQFWRFPFHQTHRDRDPVLEGLTFITRFGQRGARIARAERDFQEISKRTFFLFPLQLNSDYQIRLHSPFGTMYRAIDVVLESFASAAPADVALLIKEHPLDSGLNSWRSVITASAAALGIADRVIFVDRGDLLTMVDHAAGMVVVNSTSGTLALARGKPVKALGNPVYDIAGLTDLKPLDAFWAAPQGPAPWMYDAFCRVLADRCLIHGAFLSNVGIELLVTESARRLIAADRADVLSNQAGTSDSALSHGSTRAKWSGQSGAR
jgi:capsular polysaccharide export protein